MPGLVRPHGGGGLKPLALEVADRGAELARAVRLPALRVTSREKGDLIMLGIGGFTPLAGFMSEADWRGVCDGYRTADGLFWPIPITLSADPGFADAIAPGAEIALAEGGRFSELPNLLFPVFVHRNRQGDEALRAIVRIMAEETGPQAFVRQQRAIMTRPDCRPQLASIGCPTLVLVGDGDELTPPALSEEIVAGIAGARLVRVPDCGHLSTLERPQAVNQALVQWLKE